MKLQIKNVRANPKSGSKTLGWFTLIVADFLEINDCVATSGDKGPYGMLPSRPYEKNGETKYAKTIWINADTDHGKTFLKDFQEVVEEEFVAQAMDSELGL